MVSGAVPPAAAIGPAVQTTMTSAIKGLRHVVVLSVLFIGGLAVALLVGLNGWEYYRAPIAERSFIAANRWLRPSAPVGHALGIGGFLMMLVPVAYSIRKKVRRFRDLGRIQTWLEVHIFSGIVGPALVTFHTSFKFNGVVSVAYWSMVTVVLSGFVGRYLYVRIPKTIRGVELTQAELDARARELSQRIADEALPPSTLAAIEAFEHRIQPPPSPSYISLFAGERRMQRELRALRADARSQLHDDALAFIAERATLRRRMAYLKKTKVLFDAWHVFHMPLVYVMFVIVVVHVAVTIYMGYVPFAN
jgi:hypothetical protein